MGDSRHGRWYHSSHRSHCHRVCVWMWVSMVIKCIRTFFPGSGPVSSDRPEQSCEGVSPNHSKLLWAGNVWQGQSEARPGQGYSSGHQQKGQHQWGEYIVPILEHWGAYVFDPRTRQMALWIPDQSGMSSETISTAKNGALVRIFFLIYLFMEAVSEFLFHHLSQSSTAWVGINLL